MINPELKACVFISQKNPPCKHTTVSIEINIAEMRNRFAFEGHTSRLSNLLSWFQTRSKNLFLTTIPRPSLMISSFASTIWHPQIPSIFGQKLEFANYNPLPKNILQKKHYREFLFRKQTCLNEHKRPKTTIAKIGKRIAHQTRSKSPIRHDSSK